VGLVEATPQALRKCFALAAVVGRVVVVTTDRALVYRTREVVLPEVGDQLRAGCPRCFFGTSDACSGEKVVVPELERIDVIQKLAGVMLVSSTFCVKSF
jgi:hypothetical protein